MGDARRRRALGCVEFRGNPPVEEPLKRHVLGMVTRTMEREGGETTFHEERARKGNYVSADMRRFYHYDGVSIRRGMMPKA